MTLNHLPGILSLKEESFEELVRAPMSLTNAIIIFFSVTLIVASLQYVMRAFLYPQILSLVDPALASEVPAFAPLEFLLAIAGSLGVAFALAIIFVSLVFLATRLLGAQQGSFSDIVTVFGHAYSVRVVGFIPLIGFAAWIYYVIICVKGLAVVTKLSTARAAAAYFIVVGVFSIVAIILAIASFMYFYHGW